MAYDDLRAFLKALDEHGQLLRITDEVMPEPDIAAAANAAPRLGGNAPALYFDNVTGFTDARIAMNVHGSWANHALALGLPTDTGVKAQVDEFIARWANFPVKPVWRKVSAGRKSPAGRYPFGRVNQPRVCPFSPAGF